MPKRKLENACLSNLLLIVQAGPNDQTASSKKRI